MLREQEIYVKRADLLRELEKRKIPSHICDTSTIVMDDVLRAIEASKKILSEG